MEGKKMKHKTLPKDPAMEQKLASLIELHKAYEKELSRVIDGHMVRTKSPRGTYFYKEYVQKEGRWISRGITRKKDSIFSHARKRFLIEMVKVLEENINAMLCLQTVYRSTDPMDIIKSLPSAYDHLPLEAFCPPKKNGKSPENPYYKSTLRHTTIDGKKVRSKSELYIVSQLDKYKIPYRYEVKLRLGNHNYYPDFVINNNWTQKPIYWEHCGKVFDAAYMKAHNEKIAVYGNYGIVPWKNLIITYDDEEGNLSAQEIDLAIQNLIIKMNKGK